MLAMTTVSIILAAALFLLAKACMKWGLTTAIRWAALLCISLPVFWIVGVIVTGYLGEFGVKTLPMRTWIVIGSVIVLASWQIAKRTGWGKVLSGLFMVALCFSTIVVVVFYFLLLGVLIHATAQGVVFIAVGTLVLMGIGRNYRARGR